MSDSLPLTTYPASSIATSVPPTQGQGTLSREKLSSTAKEFESILLTEWLQSAETSFATMPGSDSEESSEAEQLRSFGVQSLAKAFSNNGGIGLASIVLNDLTRSTKDNAAGGEKTLPK